MIDQFHGFLDQQSMRAEMERNPIGFMLMRIDMRKLPWVRVELKHSYDFDGVRLRLTLREPDYGKVRAVLPEYPTPKGALRSSIPTHVEPKSAAVELDFGQCSSTEARWGSLCGNIHRFIGDGAWCLVDIISNEQAWQRIKWIRGEHVEGDPWN